MLIVWLVAGMGYCVIVSVKEVRLARQINRSRSYK